MKFHIFQSASYGARNNADTYEATFLPSLLLRHHQPLNGLTSELHDDRIRRTTGYELLIHQLISLKQLAQSLPQLLSQNHFLLRLIDEALPDHQVDF